MCNRAGCACTGPALLAAISIGTAPVAAQTGAELICLSVGGPDTLTVAAIYGPDGQMMVVTVPGEGSDEAMSSTLMSGPSDTFPALEAALVAGLADLPPPPTAEACADDPYGSVAMLVSYASGPPVRYDAPCPTDETRALNEALIEATGDPMGEERSTWSGPINPALRDICRADP